MAVNPGPAAPAGKRPLDAELNLVPFIDLLVCCICFLLITAVWVQLASVRGHTGQGTGGQAGPERQRILVLVGSDGYTLNVGAVRRVLEKRGRLYDDAGLGRALRELRDVGGDRPLVVAAEDGIPFRQLVRTMDVAHGASFTEITVSDSHGLL